MINGYPESLALLLFLLLFVFIQQTGCKGFAQDLTDHGATGAGNAAEDLKQFSILVSVYVALTRTEFSFRHLTCDSYAGIAYTPLI